MPGLLIEIWLTSADGHLDGVHVWADEEDHGALLAGDLAAALATDPRIVDPTVRGWSVDAAPPAITPVRLPPT
ncbi:hypothetical protein ACWKWC_01325 [Geodermatophilus nigrescens]|uniref:hypothetical protein n=1 Tax=Geodermatophilus sp. FMUSA9-8 TaxID=3120155 RepID=UPI0030081CD3